jgi:hypothetical protein
MGVSDVKRRRWLPFLSELGLLVMVLHLFLGSGNFVMAYNTNYYSASDGTFQ